MIPITMALLSYFGVFDALANTGLEPPRIGQIALVGNTVTADRVIVNQLGFRIGDRLSFQKLDEARANLIRTGLFDTDEPPTVEVAASNDTQVVTVVVKMKEARTGTLWFGPNLNTTQPYKGTLSATGSK